MLGLNKVFLLGFLGDDPQFSDSQRGHKFARLRLATRKLYSGTKQNDESREETVWHTVFVFGRSGENCGKYLKKGSPVFVEGHLSTYSVEEEGQKRWKSAITAERVDFLPGSVRSKEALARS